MASMMHAAQASIAMGELGVSRTDPDAPALNVLTDILNGFGGSLFNQIRSKQVHPFARAVLLAAPTVRKPEPSLEVLKG